MRKAAVLLAISIVSCGSDDPVADDRQNEGTADAAAPDASSSTDATSLDARVRDVEDASTPDSNTEDASVADASTSHDAAQSVDTGVVDAGPPVRYADVAPIFAKYCIACHTPGGAGPFPLDDYDNASGNAAQAYFMVNSDLMPPSAAVDPSTGLTDAERATLFAWVTQGTPQ